MYSLVPELSITPRIALWKFIVSCLCNEKFGDDFHGPFQRNEQRRWFCGSLSCVCLKSWTAVELLWSDLWHRSQDCPKYNFMSPYFADLNASQIKYMTWYFYWMFLDVENKTLPLALFCFIKAVEGGSHSSFLGGRASPVSGLTALVLHYFSE